MRSNAEFGDMLDKIQNFNQQLEKQRAEAQQTSSATNAGDFGSRVQAAQEAHAAYMKANATEHTRPSLFGNVPVEKAGAKVNKDGVDSFFGFNGNNMNGLFGVGHQKTVSTVWGASEGSTNNFWGGGGSIHGNSDTSGFWGGGGSVHGTSDEVRDVWGNVSDKSGSGGFWGGGGTGGFWG